MMQKPRKSRKLFSDSNTLQFATVTAMVVFVLLLVFMTLPSPHHGTGVDLARVSYAVSAPGALRQDAMRVTVTRDGEVFFGTDRVDPTELSGAIQERLKDRDVERKIYIVADKRVRWGSVKPIVDSVRSAGVLKVTLLVDQRRPLIVTR